MDEISGQFEQLKKRAKQLISSRRGSKESRGYVDDIGKLLEELETYRAELEMANEEPNRTQRDYLEARDKYVDLYEFAPVGYISLDEGDTITNANLTASKLLGYERNVLFKKRFADFIAPGDRETYYLTVKKASTEKTAISCEVRLIEKDNLLRYIHLNIVPEIDEKGNVINTRATLTDITDLKKAQRELERVNALIESVISTVAVPILVLDVSQKVVIANRAFLLFSDLKKEEVINRRIYEIGDGQWDIPGFRSVILRVLNEGETVEDHEIDHEFPDMCRRVMLVSGRPLRESRFLAAKPLLSITDITELRQGRENLQRQAELLERRNRELKYANREMESFTYTASHDLRAPLRSMDGFSQILLEEYGDKLDEKGQDYLHRIINASREMDELISGFLKLSRISRSDINISEFDASRLVEEQAKKCKSDEARRNIEFDITPNIRIKGDKFLLGVVLENLLSNAVKFSDGGAVSRIEFGEINQYGNQVFYIRDHGVGFDMKDVDRLFLPFKRLHKRSEYPGTGVGLSTVKRIIDRHNGKIWAESEPGKGTTFYFTVGHTKGEQS